MWIRVRSRCGLPPIISRTFLSAAWLTMVGERSPLWNRLFWRLISRMSSWRVTTQNGSTPSIWATPIGSLARSQR